MIGEGVAGQRNRWSYADICVGSLRTTACVRKAPQYVGFKRASAGVVVGLLVFIMSAMLCTGACYFFAHEYINHSTVVRMEKDRTYQEMTVSAGPHVSPRMSSGPWVTWRHQPHGAPICFVMDIVCLHADIWLCTYSPRRTSRRRRRRGGRGTGPSTSRATLPGTPYRGSGSPSGHASCESLKTCSFFLVNRGGSWLGAFGESAGMRLRRGPS
jgi:hypothetical protein